MTLWLGRQRMQMKNKGLEKIERRVCKDARKIKKTLAMDILAKSALGDREIELLEKEGVLMTAQKIPLMI